LLQIAVARVVSENWQQRLLAEQQRLEQLCLQVELQTAVDVDAAAASVNTLLRQLATEPAIVALRSGKTNRG